MNAYGERRRGDRPDLFGRVRVEAANPPSVQGLVVGRLRGGLGPEGGAVAGLQTGLLLRGQVLGLGPDHPGGFHVCVGLVLSPACREALRVRGLRLGVRTPAWRYR